MTKFRWTGLQSISLYQSIDVEYYTHNQITKNIRVKFREGDKSVTVRETLTSCSGV